jgi:hypothetical protein
MDVRRALFAEIPKIYSLISHIISPTIYVYSQMPLTHHRPAGLRFARREIEDAPAETSCRCHAPASGNCGASEKGHASISGPAAGNGDFPEAVCGLWPLSTPAPMRFCVAPGRQRARRCVSAVAVLLRRSVRRARIGLSRSVPHTPTPTLDRPLYLCTVTVLRPRGGE